MAVLSVILDVFEISAVFMLAVEAIKLPNIARLQGWILGSVLSRINPTITFVDDDPDPSGDWFNDNWFGMLLGVFYVLGTLLLYIMISVWDIDAISVLFNASYLDWLWIVPTIIFVPVIVGFLPLQITVWSFQLTYRCLRLVEDHTSGGAIGIFGFLLFLLQFIIRRLVD